jgi:hypothetical protein
LSSCLSSPISNHSEKFEPHIASNVKIEAESIAESVTVIQTAKPVRQTKREIQRPQKYSDSVLPQKTSKNSRNSCGNAKNSTQNNNNNNKTGNKKSNIHFLLLFILFFCDFSFSFLLSRKLSNELFFFFPSFFFSFWIIPCIKKQIDDQKVLTVKTGAGVTKQRSILVPVSAQNIKDFHTIKIVKSNSSQLKSPNIKAVAANLLQKSKQGLINKNVLIPKEELAGK